TTTIKGVKTIGVDHGRRRTGICASVGYAPRPLRVIQHNDDNKFVATEIAEEVRKEAAQHIVVGLPLDSQGREGEQANYTRVFVECLKQACPQCTIFLWDERYSTVDATEKLRSLGYNSFDMKGMIDVVASIGILTDFYHKDGKGA
ncbi:hypothetical protein GUITHDRAFT_52173, partial [Guillardia theta CCMP2712]